MDPLPSWRMGAQMVSLNYQTNDTPVQISRALFALDNGFGCVLKPLLPPRAPEMTRDDPRYITLDYPGLQLIVR